MVSFRAARSTRSGRPTQENDVMDGLPIRQWRMAEASVGVAPQEQAEVPEVDTIWKELAMPKDSHLYQPWVQQLLRAARAGLINKPERSATDDEKENGTEGNGGDTSKSSAAAVAATAVAQSKALTARKWSQLPRSAEETEREYLAKRRRGLQSRHVAISNGTVPAADVPMRKTKVKKVDADGNTSIWEVLVPEGQTVEGEIAGELTLESAAAPIAAPAPGTVVEGIGIANAEGVIIATEAAPLKRRGPPPRRKKKGPGRGRRKLAYTPGDGVSASAEALAASKGLALGQAGTINGESQAAGSVDGVAPTGETHEDEHDDDDDEGDESDEEGEEGNEGSELHEDEEVSATPEVTPAIPVTTDAMDISSAEPVASNTAVNETAPLVPPSESTAIGSTNVLEEPVPAPAEVTTPIPADSAEPLLPSTTSTTNQPAAIPGLEAAPDTPSIPFEAPAVAQPATDETTATTSANTDPMDVVEPSQAPEIPSASEVPAISALLAPEPAVDAPTAPSEGIAAVQEADDEQTVSNEKVETAGEQSQEPETQPAPISAPE